MLEHLGLTLETFPNGSYACNCTVIFSQKTKEAIIIDPGNDSQTIIDYVNKQQLKVKKLLHTHAHFDHIGQSDEVRKQVGGELLLHQGDQFLYEALEDQGRFFGMNLPKPGKVDTWLEDEMSFSLNEEISDSHLNEFLKTVFTPGHTPGSCCFYTEKFDHPVLIAGDTLFRSSIGRTDLPGGDSELILKSIKNRLYELPDETLVITGHGPTTSLGEEKRSNPFVQA